MRKNINTRKLVLNAILLAIGLVLHQITPPIFAIKPDTTLIMLFTVMFINKDDYKTCLICGIIAGIFAGMTSAFPGGQVPNLIDKIVTTNLVFLMMAGVNKLLSTTNLSQRVKSIIVTSVMMVIGTAISGFVFLTSAQILVGLPGDFTALFMAVVAPAMIINLIVGIVIYKIINVTLEKAVLQS